MQFTHSSLRQSLVPSSRYKTLFISSVSPNSESLLLDEEFLTVADPNKIPGSFLPSTPEATPEPESPITPRVGTSSQQEDQFRLYHSDRP
ncbi:hypothetical protein PCANC_22076 [Puccinia coronata f. sp. avenae]|uniref:Uncharacterized protein n=1 Tax=Puccinia coronata f. sp. avenae TaxID=200324 RepID=A0A2N5UIP9_9BASI|nr:hypothetical protein PCANC_22076 [Puccinia coronata f. sp. avenae]